MAAKRRSALLTDADSNVPDNTSKEVSPKKVRDRLRDLADSAQLRANSALNLLDYIPDAEHDAIRAYTSTFDCLPALNEAIAALPANGGVIHIGAGRFSFSGTIHLGKRVSLIGEGSGYASGTSSQFRFPANTLGIVVHHVGSHPSGSGRSDSTVIEGLRIFGSGTTDTTAHGIWLRGRANVHNCSIDGFPGNGLHILATAGSEDPDRLGNANNWQAERLRITGCKNGVYIEGADVNAGVSVGVDATANDEWGIWDSSFLGNTHIAAHTNGNGVGPYKSDNANARTVWLGCYSETNQDPSQIASPSMVVGGLHAAGVSGSGLRILDGNLSPFRVRRQDGARIIDFSLGPLSDTAFNFEANGGDEWSLMWNEDGGTFALRHARLNTRTALALTTDLSTTLLDEAGSAIGGGRLIQQGSWVKLANGRYRFVDLADLVVRIEALETQ